jgi:uncharacterized protein (TIGR00369 family)
VEATTTEVWREEPRGGYPDPRLVALSGRERMESWTRGLSPVPPLFHLTGARPTGYGAGTAEAEMPATGWLTSSPGVILGGALAIVTDIAFGLAVQTELPAATLYTTAELSLTFLRPLHPGGAVTAAGQAIHVGRSVGLSEAFVLEQESERLIAHGTSRLTIRPPLDPPPEPPDDLTPPEREEHETPSPFQRAPAGQVIPQETWAEVPGVEVLARQLAGDLPSPPIHYLTGLTPTGYDEGRATMRLPCTRWLSSPAGTVQGGVTAMLADAAMLTAVQTTTPAGTAIAGLDLKVNFLRPVFPDGRDLTAHGEIVHRGRTLAVTRAEILNADAKPVALATGSSMYLPDRPATLGEVELSSG